MPQSPCDIQKDGRGAQIRTGDPLLPKQVRYQAALHPDPRITRVFWLFKQALKSTEVELSGHCWREIPPQIPPPPNFSGRGGKLLCSQFNFMPHLKNKMEKILPVKITRNTVGFFPVLDE